MAFDDNETPESVLVDFLSMAYDCHTLVLYGSRTVGKERADSDWDLVAVNDWDGPTWYNDEIAGVGEVNAFIYPEKHINSPRMNDVLNMNQFCFGLRNGRVLAEKDGLGQKIIAEAKRVFETPPPPAPPSFRDSLVHFYSETVLDTIDDPAKPELAKHCRHHEVIVKSLFNYFTLRGQLRPPAKDALLFLQAERPEHYAAFAKAAARGATMEDLQGWLKIVLDNQ